ncbi:hypothetical protein BGZ91_002586, partial [Linnemannia elongata]
MPWYLHATEQGYTKGQQKIGLMYEYDAKVPKDHTKAVAWYLKAVAQRNGVARPIVTAKVRMFRGIISTLQI